MRYCCTVGIYIFLFFFPSASASEESSRTASASGGSSPACASSRPASEGSSGACGFIPGSLTLDVGDIILLDKPRDHEETDMWLGCITESPSKNSIKHDWVTRDDCGLWSIGSEGWEKSARKQVLGKLTGWNGIGVMPEEITKLLDFSS